MAYHGLIVDLRDAMRECNKAADYLKDALEDAYEGIDKNGVGDAAQWGLSLEKRLADAITVCQRIQNTFPPGRG